jgi:hypothetical protein
VPAGLLDVPPVAFGGATEGLAQRHHDRLGVHVGAARAQPGKHDVGVRLAHAPQHHLVSLGVALQPQCWVRGHQPAQPAGQRVFVAAAAAHYCHRQ